MNLKIAYVTVYDALNNYEWSGSGHAIAKMLEDQNAELDYIGNLKVPLWNMLRMKKALYKRLWDLNFIIYREPFVAKHFARQIKSRIKQGTNIIFSPGSIPIALLETDRPKVFYTDATFAGMADFYESYSNLSKETLIHGHYLEQKALESADLAIFSSDWAARSARENYRVKPEKIKVVPFGANIDCNRNEDAIRELVSRRSKKSLELLFIGMDWKRKGGELAVRIAHGLNEMGIETVLHVAGIKVFPVKDPPAFIRYHGYINKYSAEGKKLMDDLFARSHFLLVPSVAEAFGLVFCEANSFGVPSISTNVGGIPTIIRDDVNGKTFAPHTQPGDWCEYIATCFRDHGKYCAMCLSSFHEYHNRLNWDVAGRSIMKLIRNL